MGDQLAKVVAVGGWLFVAFGLITAAVAYSDWADIDGAKTGDLLLVLNRALLLSALGLLCVAAGAMLNRRS